MSQNSTQAHLRLAVTALCIVAIDQFTKWIVVKNLFLNEERILIDGFFRFVHWGNTGAAWSMFKGNNYILGIVAIIALVVLYLSRRHFEFHRLIGQLALGLMFGGIIGNLIDRWREGHVIDFIYFYVNRRGGGEIGFPAFNIADSAICTGVGLLFLLSWQREQKPTVRETPKQGELDLNA